MEISSLSAATTVELLDKAKQGDSSALDTLLRRYLPRLRRFATGRLPASVRGALDTEDVVQETVIKALRQLPTFHHRGDGALQAYLRQAVLNRVTDLHRRAASRPQQEALSSDLAEAGASPLEQAIGAATVVRYEQALKALKDHEREIVIMRVEMACDYDEIADAFGLSGAAHARVAFSRALAKLAREMGDPSGERTQSR